MGDPTAMNQTSTLAGDAKLDYVPDQTEWAWFWSYNSAAVAMLILCVIHSFNVYQDLFTAQRASVSHRKTKPPITKQYKTLQYLTLAVVYFHFGDSFFFGLEMASYSWSKQVCIALNGIGGWFLLPGKGIMYMLIMYRLIVCYQGSAFAYNKRVLIAIGWANVVFAVLIEIITTLFKMLALWKYGQDVDEFPNPCFPITGDSALTDFFPITLQIWDFLMNILSLTLFLYPMRKLRAINSRSIETVDHRNSTSRRTIENMHKLAIKYTVLTFIAATSTGVFWLFVYVAPNEYFLVAHDVVINSWCVMMMTAYYPNYGCCCLQRLLGWQSAKSTDAVEMMEKNMSRSDASITQIDVDTAASNSNLSTATGNESPRREKPETDFVNREQILVRSESNASTVIQYK
mmetsp:Transcript_48797/g.77992  ORF Transcript_48797/g.77992 Transcript_48797/m.77992 type:complete len:402 (+) Transcript_48797:38-1243(+)